MKTLGLQPGYNIIIMLVITRYELDLHCNTILKNIWQFIYLSIYITHVLQIGMH